jgi:hypothetical protein
LCSLKHFSVGPAAIFEPLQLRRLNAIPARIVAGADYSDFSGANQVPHVARSDRQRFSNLRHV